MLPFSLEDVMHVSFLTHNSFSLKPAPDLQAVQVSKLAQSLYPSPLWLPDAFTPAAAGGDVAPHGREQHPASRLRELCFKHVGATWSLRVCKVDLRQQLVHRDSPQSLSCSSRKWVKHKLLLFRNMLDQLIINAFYLGKKQEPNKNSWNKTEDFHQTL